MINIEDLKALPTPQRIGRRIVAIRVLRKMTQKDLAKECGISSNTLYAIENGVRDAQLSTIMKIEEVLGASLILVPNEDLI